MQSKPKVLSRPVNHRRHQECAARSTFVSFGCGPSFLRASDARHLPHRRSCCVFVRPRDAGRDWNSRVREEGTKDAASRAASANRSNSKHHKDERDSTGSKRLRTGSAAVGTAASNMFVRAVSSSPQTQLVTLPGRSQHAPSRRSRRPKFVGSAPKSARSASRSTTRERHCEAPYFRPKALSFGCTIRAEGGRNKRCSEPSGFGEPKQFEAPQGRA